MKETPLRLCRAVLMGSVLFAGACGGDSNGTDNGAIQIALASATLQLAQGGTGTMVVTVTRTTFTGAVTLSVQNLPSGVTAPSVTVASGATTGTLTFTATSSAAVTTTPVTIRASGSGVDAVTAPLSLAVQAGGSFTLNGAGISLAAGANLTTPITVNRANGFTGTVALSASAPAGFTVSIAPTSLAGTATAATLSVTAAAATAAGSYTVTVTGTSAGLSDQTLSVPITVVGASGGFSLSLSAATLSAAAGANATSTVTINRVGAFAGAVALTATVPAGLTASFAPASVTGTPSTLTLTVGAGVTAGTQLSVTVRGNATGLTEQTATLSLTVSAAGGVGNVVWTFCGLSGLPLYVAAQDGAGAWTQVTGVANAFTFQINGAKGGVTYVTATAGGGFDTQVFYGTVAELQARGTNLCSGNAGAGKTVTGTIAGATAGDLVSVNLGRASANPNGPGAFTLTGVQSGSLDLIAGRSALAVGPPVSITPTGFLIQRNLTIADNGTVGTLNFATATAPASAALTVNNLLGDQLILSSSYVTANNTFGVLFGSGLGATSPTTWYGIPAASQVAGDAHVLTVIAFSGVALAPTRSVTLVSAAVAARTVTMGAQLVAPVVTVTATTPYVRLKLDQTLQAEYGKLIVANFQQGAAATLRTATIQTTSGYLAGAGTISPEVPALSGIGPFDNNWGLKTAVSTTWTLTATGWTSGDLLAANPYVDGGVFTSGSRQGTITP